MRRQAGVVLPLFSIRTLRDWGVGQISDLPLAAAWVKTAGHRLIQILPPHELSAGESSPYGALSAFALDPVYLDVDAVPDLDAPAVEGALGPEGLAVRERARSAPYADYEAVRGLKKRALSAAFDAFVSREWTPRTARAARLAAFVREERSWLDDFALYSVIRETRGAWGWTTWPEPLRDRSRSALAKVRADHERKLLEVAYVQWLLAAQWQRAHAAMRDLGVELMGDIPFIVGTESSDVWARPSQFQIHASLGAPPDEFSAEGQDWGLPAYDWLAMEADGLGWIRARTARAATLYDRFRLDHVVGNFRQWVRRRKGVGESGRFDPEGTDAQRARGRRVLGAMLAELANRPLEATPPRGIAEDLGVIPAFVREVLTELAMPGYRVLPWERDGERFRDPKAFPTSSVASWSTHDTPPIDGWWLEFTSAERAALGARAGVKADMSPSARSLALLGDLYGARSDLALVLAQELLGVTDRINTPGTVGRQNWTWRLPEPLEHLMTNPERAARFDAIRRLVVGSGR